MYARKWQNHVVVPLEALGGRDLHQIQSEVIEAESQRRKTLQAMFASVPDLVVSSSPEGKVLTTEPESEGKSNRFAEFKENEGQPEELIIPGQDNASSSQMGDASLIT